MSPKFQLKTLGIAVTTLSISSLAQAGGLDRSGQDITSFLQNGTYAEMSYTYIDANVTGNDNKRVATTSENYEKGRDINDIAEPYDFIRYGVKTDINDTFSLGVLYDEPWGAAAKYTDGSNFSGSPLQTVNSILAKVGSEKQLPIKDIASLQGVILGAKQQLDAGKQKVAAGEQALQQGRTQLEQAKKSLAATIDPTIKAGIQAKITEGEKQLADLEQKVMAGKQQLQQGQADLQRLKGLEGVVKQQLANNESTNVEVRSKSITGIVGAKLGEKKQLQVYGGATAQRIYADVKLRGDSYKQATGYTAHLQPNESVGWLAGVSYSKPEIGLKAAVTYRSKIDHDTKISEVMPLVALRGQPTGQTEKITVTTPESVNVDFQTGINKTTLATAKVRYVPWSKFKITPPLYNGVSGLNLVDYDSDQWQVELGLGKRINPKLAVSGTVGWDSGAGNPTTSLGPIKGYYSAGLGAKFNITENWAISAGGKYLWFGDAQGKLPNGEIVADFKDNTGYIAGVKVSYETK